MQHNSQQVAVLDSEQAWLLPIPKDSFTPPKFRLGQMVMSLQDQACGRIVGMEFVSKDSEASETCELWLVLHDCFDGITRLLTLFCC